MCILKILHLPARLPSPIWPLSSSVRKPELSKCCCTSLQWTDALSEFHHDFFPSSILQFQHLGFCICALSASKVGSWMRKDIFYLKKGEYIVYIYRFLQKTRFRAEQFCKLLKTVKTLSSQMYYNLHLCKTWFEIEGKGERGKGGRGSANLAGEILHISGFLGIPFTITYFWEELRMLEISNLVLVSPRERGLWQLCDRTAESLLRPKPQISHYSSL